MLSSDPYSSEEEEEDDDDDDDDDDDMMGGMEPGLGDKQSLREPSFKSPSLSYSNTVPDRKGPPQGVPLTNSKKSHISSKGRAEGSRNNLIDNFHNLSGTSQTHDYDKSILNGGRKTGYLTKSSNLLPLSSSRSSDSMERDTSSGMVMISLIHLTLQVPFLLLY